MKKFIWAFAAYSGAAIWLIRSHQLGDIGWLVFLSTAFLGIGMAISADAVYDSLNEKLDRDTGGQ